MVTTHIEGSVPYVLGLWYQARLYAYTPGVEVFTLFTYRLDAKLKWSESYPTLDEAGRAKADKRRTSCGGEAVSSFSRFEHTSSIASPPVARKRRATTTTLPTRSTVLAPSGVI
jgi:hypothetical protein